MAAQHTPGPWIAICDDVTEGLERGDSGIRFWSIREEGKYRGEVAHCHQAAHIGGITIDERDANAHLVSAAPDLLEVAPDAVDLLEQYADFIRTVKADDLERHPYLPSIDDTVRGLRAAIAKAEGRS